MMLVLINLYFKSAKEPGISEKRYANVCIDIGHYNAIDRVVTYDLNGSNEELFIIDVYFVDDKRPGRYSIPSENLKGEIRKITQIGNGKTFSWLRSKENVSEFYDGLGTGTIHVIVYRLKDKPTIKDLKKYQKKIDDALSNERKQYQKIIEAFHDKKQGKVEKAQEKLLKARKEINLNKSLKENLLTQISDYSIPIQSKTVRVELEQKGYCAFDIVQYARFLEGRPTTVAQLNGGRKFFSHQMGENRNISLNFSSTDFVMMANTGYEGLVILSFDVQYGFHDFKYNGYNYRACWGVGIRTNLIIDNKESEIKLSRSGKKNRRMEAHWKWGKSYLENSLDLLGMTTKDTVLNNAFASFVSSNSKEALEANMESITAAWANSNGQKEPRLLWVERVDKM